MLTILNRLRGTKAIWAKVNGAILASLFYWLSKDVYTSISIGALYILGESFGWGKWIGGIMSGNRLSPTPRQLDDREGLKNGIHFLANLIAPEIKNYYEYCIVALGIRGMYWFGLTLLPLVIAGYVDPIMYMPMILLLGVGFPLSVILGKWSKDKITITQKYFNVHGTWEHAEVWYGFMQDVILVALFLSVLI